MTKTIRWICEKCDKKWIHPVEQCLYCNGDIKKQIGTKLKVIGNTKVHVPSPLHPIVPYNILMLEDEKGNRMPKKTIKDYNLGEVYEDKVDASENTVAVVKIKYDFYEAVKEALEQLEQVSKKRNVSVEKIVICSHVGTNQSKIYFDFVKKLKNKKIKLPFCIIIPSELHFIEEEALGVLGV